jgi:sulfonate transport system permease protein
MIKHKSSILDTKTATVLISLILPIIIILIWYAGSNNGFFNASILPTPQKVGNCFQSMIADGSLWQHILASFGRVIRGFAIGAASGMLLGLLIGLYFRLNQLFTALIGILRPIPPIAMIPLFIMWLGIGEPSKIALVTVGAFWPVLLNTIAGVQSTDPKLVEVAGVFGKNRWIILKDIIIPSAIPSVFTGLRLSISTAWSCVVAAEMIAADKGVGYLIMFARQMSKPAELFVGIISIGVIGLAIDILFQLLQKKVVYWNRTAGK